MEIVVAVIGAVLALFGYQQVMKFKANKGQKELVKKVNEIDRSVANLEGQSQQIDKQTQEKVDEITKEQNTKLTGSDLADWFNKRK